MENNLQSLKTYASRNSVPIVFDETSKFICDYIKNNNVQSVLEIGTAIGYSAIKFALAGAERVVSVEIDLDRYLKAQQNVKNEGLEEKITLIHGDALKTEIEGEFDLIFIDGPKAQYINFFEKYKANLSEGGVIISDNLSFHGMVENLSLTHNYSTKKLVKKIQKYIRFLETNEEFTTEFFPVGDRIAISNRK